MNKLKAWGFVIQFGIYKLLAQTTEQIMQNATLNTLTDSAINLPDASGLESQSSFGRCD